MKPFTAIILAVLMPVAAAPPALGARACPPTPADAIGPFYRPDAPQRSRIGSGYLLTGAVLSSVDCSPVKGARIEVWQTGPDSRYDDAHRATIFSDANGGYRLETDFPPPYAGRPSHIHIRVRAHGFQGLITQHYPARGSSQDRFDLVLRPEE
jgi:protocatechuate 3,4-dioxygenase beta subunit